MAKELRRVNFDEFAQNPQKFFDDLATQKQPVIIAMKGRTYRLEIEATEDIWSEYDPEKARKGLKKGAGAFAGVDREALLRDLHGAREQASHGRSD